MKTIETITDISHDDLVNLISTATYASPWLDFRYNKADCRDISPDDCAEDIAAKILLAGGTIEFFDYLALDNADLYADTAYYDGRSGIYPVSLETLRKGLESALNGTFNTDDARELSFLRRCAREMAEPEPDIDAVMAEALMQVILFNETIY